MLSDMKELKAYAHWRIHDLPPQPAALLDRVFRKHIDAFADPVLYAKLRADGLEVFGAQSISSTSTTKPAMGTVAAHFTGCYLDLPCGSLCAGSLLADCNSERCNKKIFHYLDDEVRLVCGGRGNEGIIYGVSALEPPRSTMRKLVREHQLDSLMYINQKPLAERDPEPITVKETVKEPIIEVEEEPVPDAPPKPNKGRSWYALFIWIVLILALGLIIWCVGMQLQKYRTAKVNSEREMRMQILREEAQAAIL